MKTCIQRVFSGKLFKKLFWKEKWSSKINFSKKDMYKGKELYNLRQMMSSNDKREMINLKNCLATINKKQIYLKDCWYIYTEKMAQLIFENNFLKWSSIGWSIRVGVSSKNINIRSRCWIEWRGRRSMMEYLLVAVALSCV